MGSVDELPATGFARLVAPVITRRHWESTTVRHLVYVRREEEGGATAFLGRCSHMGCTVGWDQEAESFRCPCHEGHFDAEGRVLSGPATRGLTRLEVSIEDGQVRVELPG